MKKKILISLLCFLLLFSGAFIFGLTVHIKPVHIIAMVLLVLGGYTLKLVNLR